MTLSFRETAEELDDVRPPDRIVDREHQGVFGDSSVDAETDLSWLGVVSDLIKTGEDETRLQALVNDSDAYSFTRGTELGFGHRDAKGLAATIRWHPEDVESAPQSRRSPADDDRYALRPMIDRRARDGATKRKLLCLNTWMLRAAILKVFIDWWTPGWIAEGADKEQIVETKVAAKPVIDQRRDELGASINDVGYDVVGLIEVFGPGDVERIVNLVEGGIGVTGDQVGPPSTKDVTITYPVGAPGVKALEIVGEDLAGSGLLTLTTGRGSDATSMVRDERRGSPDRITFTDQGYLLRDADAFSKKGVLYTEIDLGPGNIDFFTTHFFAGGGLFDNPEAIEQALRTVLGTLTFGLSNLLIDMGKRSESEFKLSQLADLVEFVEKKQKPENVTIVGGDFNIRGVPNDDSVTLYQHLLEAMYGLGLQDLWLARGGESGTTRTWEKIDGSKPTDRPSKNCSFDSDGRMPFPCDPYDADTAGLEGRIDYLFVELPHEDHSFDLDVGRPRRVALPREDGVVPRHISDHLGLELELYASPR